MAIILDQDTGAMLSEMFMRLQQIREITNTYEHGWQLPHLTLYGDGSGTLILNGREEEQVAGWHGLEGAIVEIEQYYRRLKEASNAEAN